MANTTTTRPQSAQPVGRAAKSAPATIEGEMLPVRVESAVPEYDSIDSAARLLLGGAADLSDLLLKLLQHWEETIVAQQEATIVEQEEDPGDIVRYLLIGLAFQSQRQLRSSASAAGNLVMGAAGATVSITQPVVQSRLFSPFRSAAGVVTNRFESKIAELVQTGRSQEFVGRLMAEAALQETVDWVMDYIAQNPEIRDLVQQQALGFTEEIAIGVRERAITADNLFDGLLRKLLRRTPRANLPGPPPEVKHLEARYNELSALNREDSE